MNNLILALQERYGELHDGHGRHEYQIPCPACGARPAHLSDKPQQPNCQVNTEKYGWKCHSCKAGGAIYISRKGKLVIRATDGTILGEHQTSHQPVRTIPKKDVYEVAHPWVSNPQQGLGAIQSPLTLDMWRKYEKALSGATVRRWGLGFGRVYPGYAPTIVYPVWSGGVAVGFRQRYKGAWRSLKGSKSQLFCTDQHGQFSIQHNQVLVLCESPIEVMLGTQRYPRLGWCAPTNGVNSWKSQFFDLIEAFDPSCLFVAFDNDHAGYRAANKLYHEYGARFEMHRINWAGAPHKYDLRDALSADASNLRRQLVRWTAET